MHAWICQRTQRQVGFEIHMLFLVWLIEIVFIQTLLKEILNIDRW